MNNAMTNNKVFPNHQARLVFIKKACFVGNILIAIGIYSVASFYYRLKGGTVMDITPVFLGFTLLQLSFGNVFATIIGFIPALITTLIINARAHLKQPYKNAFIAGFTVMSAVSLLIFLINLHIQTTQGIGSSHTNSILSILLNHYLVLSLFGGVIMGGIPAMLGLYLTNTSLFNADKDFLFHSKVNEINKRRKYMINAANLFTGK